MEATAQTEASDVPVVTHPPSQWRAPAPVIPPQVRVRSGAAAPLRIVAIGDTHERHWELLQPGDDGQDLLPPGDVLIHCGDIFRTTCRMTREDFMKKFGDFRAWLKAVRPRYRLGVIVIPGNHDTWLEKLGVEAVRRALPDCTYLVHEGVTLAGVSFYGCPVSFGRSCNRGFQDFQAGDDPRQRLPRFVDVLITHGSHVNSTDGVSILRDFVCPPRGTFGQRCRLHIAGHDHDFYGAVLAPVTRKTPTVPVAAFAARADDADDVAEWLRRCPVTLPRPQIACLGSVKSQPGASSLLRSIAHHAPCLRDGAPSQRPAVIDFVRASLRNASVAAAGTATGDAEPASQSASRTDMGDASMPVSSDDATAPARSPVATKIPIELDTVTVVASTLDMRYKVAHRPVEIDIFPSAAAVPVHELGADEPLAGADSSAAATQRSLLREAAARFEKRTRAAPRAAAEPPAGRSCRTKLD